MSAEEEPNLKNLELLFKKTEEEMDLRSRDGNLSAHDDDLRSAIRSYIHRLKSRNKENAFIEAYNSVLTAHNKLGLIHKFALFVQNEIGLENALPNHQSHHKHSIQVFLLGFNINFLFNQARNVGRNF